MTVRRTSIVAYNTIKAKGLLSARRWEAYDALYRHGPCTINELIQKMIDDAGVRGHSRHRFERANVHPRVNELLNLGVAYEVRERTCTITGMTVIEYDVNGSLPAGSPRLKTKLDLARERISELEIEVAQLKARLARMAMTPV